jgi:hypothetical protein
VGFSVFFGQRFVGDLYYRREHSISSIEDNNLNIMGINMKLLF